LAGQRGNFVSGFQGFKVSGFRVSALVTYWLLVTGHWLPITRRILPMAKKSMCGMRNAEMRSAEWKCGNEESAECGMRE